MVEHYSSVTPEFLVQTGIRGLICDIDNTLAPYEEAEPDAAALRWFSALREAGIRVAFVSNNSAGRVARYNRSLGYPAFPRSKKPLTGALRRAMIMPQATVALVRRSTRMKEPVAWLRT